MDGQTPAPRKRTRRGSRGGRNRKKKPAAAGGDGTGEGGDGVPEAVGADASTDDGSAPETGADEPSHDGALAARVSSDANGEVSEIVADVDLAEPRAEHADEPAATESRAAADSGERAADDVESETPDVDGGYVPMSQWIDDFDRPRGRS